MHGKLIVALAIAASVAHADDAITAEADTSEAIPDQGLGASVGVAGGGRVTPGGLRVEGHYLYQLSDVDWFDGTASFTFGGGGAECFRDRMDFVVCDHGFASGRGVEVIAAVRRYFAAQGRYRPYARAGVGIGIARFSDDDLTGVTIPLHLGGGIRAAVADDIAVVAAAELVAGIARFGSGLGTEPQLGIAVTAGAEFRLP